MDLADKAIWFMLALAITGAGLGIAGIVLNTTPLLVFFLLPVLVALLVVDGYRWNKRRQDAMRQSMGNAHPSRPS